MLVKLIAILMMMALSCMDMQAQQSQAASKTFVVKTSSSKAVNDTTTGVKVTLKDGKTYPVYKGSRGGLYTYRTASKGPRKGAPIKVALSSAMSKEEYAQLKKMCGVK